MFTLCSVAYAGAAPIVGWMTTFLPSFPLIVIGLLGAAFSLCILGPMPHFPNTVGWQIVALSLLGVGCAMSLVPTVPQMVKRTSHLGPEAPSLVAGLITAAYSLGQIIGPFLGGLLLDLVSFPVATMCYAIFVVVVAVAMIIYRVIWDRETHWASFESQQQPLLDVPARED